MGHITPNWICAMHMSKWPCILTVENMWPSTHTVAYLRTNVYLWGVLRPWNIPLCDEQSCERHSHTMVFLYDILITGSMEEEYLTALDQVLNRLEQAGFHLKRLKCSFMASEVQYLGHKIDQEGIHAMSTLSRPSRTLQHLPTTQSLGLALAWSTTIVDFSMTLPLF